MFIKSYDMLFKKFQQFVVRHSENKMKMKTEKEQKQSECQLYFFGYRYLNDLKKSKFIEYNLVEFANFQKCKVYHRTILNEPCMCVSLWLLKSEVCTS